MTNKDDFICCLCGLEGAVLHKKKYYCIYCFEQIPDKDLL